MRYERRFNKHDVIEIVGLDDYAFRDAHDTKCWYPTGTKFIVMKNVYRPRKGQGDDFWMYKLHLYHYETLEYRFIYYEVMRNSRFRHLISSDIDPVFGAIADYVVV